MKYMKYSVLYALAANKEKEIRIILVNINYSYITRHNNL